MPDEIEDLVIETGVDSLMNYLAENGKASCKEISKEIGVDKERVENWGNALAQQDLVEKHHTLTSGLVLEYSQKNLEEASRKKAEIEAELDEKSDDVNDELSDKGEAVGLTKEKLQEQSMEDAEKEEAVEETVESLEELEKRIDRKLENDELDSQTLQLISEVEKVLHQVEELIRKHLNEEQGEKLGEKSEEAVKEVEQVFEKAEREEGFEESQEEIKKKLKAVKKLENNIEKARKNYENSKSSSGIKSKLRGLIPVKRSSSNDSESVSKNTGNSSPVKKEIDEAQKIKKNDVPEKTYQELVDENRVTEVMRKISLIKDPDYKSILEAEKFNRDRPQLTSYLEERVKDVG